MPDWIQELFFGPGPVAWVQQTLGLGWPFPFRVVSLLGISWGVVLALGLALWLWGRRALYSLAAIIVLEALVSMAMNRVFSVDRPDAPSIVKYEHVDRGSFPSGHLFTATVVWGWLHASGRLPFVVAAAVVLGVGVSRLYLGVHYLGDVIGAVVFGAALVWLHGRTWPRVREWLAARPAAFFDALALGFALTGVLAMTVLFPGDPYVASAAGVIVAGAAALRAQERWVRHEPPPPGWRARLPIVLLGLAGIVPPLLLEHSLDGGSPVLSALATGVATLWALLAVPALHARGAARPGVQRSRSSGA